MRGGLNMSKLPGDYSSCVCVGYFYSSTQRVEGVWVSLHTSFVCPLHFCSLPPFFKKCCSFESQLDTSAVLCVISWWTWSVKIHGKLLTLASKLSSDHSAVFHIVKQAVFSPSPLSHLDTLVAVIIAHYLSQRTWDIVMEHRTKHELFTWDLSRMCHLPLSMSSHYWAVGNQSHWRLTPPPPPPRPLPPPSTLHPHLQSHTYMQICHPSSLQPRQNCVCMCYLCCTFSL